MIVNIIAAVAKNGVIGSCGKIPWNYPEDMKYFKQLTTGCVVIMGRRTFEEIGKPLPDRFNIIVSRTKRFSAENLKTAENLESALSMAEKAISDHNLSKNIFLCGGRKIYEQGLEYAEKLYITEINENYDGDTFFPDFPKDQFRSIKNTNGITDSLRFHILKRI